MGASRKSFTDVTFRSLTLSALLRDVAKLDDEQRNFRVFGPDETLSNGLEALLASTQRQWGAATLSDDEVLAPTGRVVEMLSEQQCEGWLEGYTAALEET